MNNSWSIHDDLNWVFAIFSATLITNRGWVDNIGSRSMNGKLVLHTNWYFAPKAVGTMDYIIYVVCLLSLSNIVLSKFTRSNVQIYEFYILHQSHSVLSSIYG